MIGQMEDIQLSPNAASAQRITNFKNIDAPSKLSAAGIQKQSFSDLTSEKQLYCICGLPCPPN